MPRIKSAYNGLTHREICEIGASYCTRMFRCPISLCEPSSLSLEKPDVFAVKYGSDTILLEAKISRSDFMKDKTKDFRNNPDLGVGLLRYYITPKGLLTLDDLPPKWGLIEVDCKKKATFVHGQHPRKIYDDKWKFKTRNIYNEFLILTSALRKTTNELKKERRTK